MAVAGMVGVGMVGVGTVTGAAPGGTIAGGGHTASEFAADEFRLAAYERHSEAHLGFGKEETNEKAYLFALSLRHTGDDEEATDGGRHYCSGLLAQGKGVSHRSLLGGRSIRAKSP